MYVCLWDILLHPTPTATEIVVLCIFKVQPLREHEPVCRFGFSLKHTHKRGFEIEFFIILTPSLLLERENVRAVIDAFHEFREQLYFVVGEFTGKETLYIFAGLLVVHSGL